MSDERRTRGEIPWSWVDRQLSAAGEIWVATAGRGGPDAVPVWFWWDGSALYFTTNKASRKARNLAGDPRIVLHNGNGIDAIVVKGDARVVTDPVDLERADRAWHDKYVAPETGEHATIYVDDDVCFRVPPRLVMAWRYANVGTRTDWRFT